MYKRQAIDRALVAGALRIAAGNTAALMTEAAELTGLANPNSVAQLKDWLAEALDRDELPDLRKETVSDLLGDLPDNDARRVLEIRQELCKTSTKKYNAMEAAVGPDGRVRGLLQFYGANRTGRWAGRLVQVQNLPRTHLAGIDTARTLVKEGNGAALRLGWGNVPDTLSQLVRTAFVPAPGRRFVDADFSAIEARVIAWLAGEQWVLEVFRTHGKIYEATASQMFGVPMERIVKGKPEYGLRQQGKVAQLACGYGGGEAAMARMDYGHAIDPAEYAGLVKKWREANPAIVSLWRKVEDAALCALRVGRCELTLPDCELQFTYEGDDPADQRFLTILLPSGRKLFYARPTTGINRFGNTALCYMGLNQVTRKWELTETYGGKLVENIVQAVARDCLAVNIERLEAAGYPIVFHVHDEIVAEVAAERADLSAICEIMSRPIPWAPGLPLRADGWVGNYYTKD